MKFVSPEEFNHFHRPIRDKILSRKTVSTVLCVAKESPSTILGWVIIEALLHSPGKLLHYIYVKEAFKNEGISKELLKFVLPEGLVLYSHMTEKAQKIMKRSLTNYQRFHYTPHLL